MKPIVEKIQRIMSVLFASLMIVISASQIAASETLSGQELKSFVNGKRVYLRIPLGGEFPLFYRANGQVTGDGTTLGLGKYFAPKETGRWFVDGSKLCQQFPTWYKGRVSCFRIYKTGETTLRWTRDDGYSGRARISG
ncbi:MAG: hypothetical protein AAFR71_08700 [Pseudomonadota bacterium]